MTVLNGFELLQEREIPEINTRAQIYRHTKTGARLISLLNDDENKLFSITFRTLPSDDTGVAHIMEHSVLGGSAKYPVKEPFVELLKGSMASFVNAMTFPDKTTYPVASQNLQDFYNLMDVYLDAAFHPNISRHTLDQEGWHYELETLDGPLTYRGIVFNEMKGAYSDPEGLLADEIYRALLPGGVYGHYSGGHPRSIPDLTYQQFRTFYETFYHPSNAYFFFYGNAPLEEQLSRVDAVLSDFTARDVDTHIDPQPRFDRPHTVTVPYAVDPENVEGARAMLAIGWMLDENNTPTIDLAYGILAEILLGSPASPLRKALLDSGLGEDLVSVPMDGVREPLFITGLKGIDGSDADQVEKLVLGTLAQLSEDGIDPLMTEAALNTVEFMLRENHASDGVRGLPMLLRVFGAWLYDRDPLEWLAFEAPLQELKEKLAQNPHFFEELIHTQLLNNPHRLRLLLQPDPDLARRQDEEEHARLEKARAAMSPADLQAVLENTRLLHELQARPDDPADLAAIPSLKRTDLDQQNTLIPFEELDEGGVKVLYHDLPTNGIVYLDLGFDLHTLPQELLPYLPLFGRALLELGTEAEDEIRLAQHIGRSTGGISQDLFATSVHGQPETSARMFLRGKATVEKAPELLSILKDILLHTRFDNPERFRQMALEEKAGQESSLIPAGHMIVLQRLRAHFDETGFANEEMSGLSNLFFTRRLAQEVKENWPSVLQRLETIRQTLLNRAAALCNVTVERAGWESLQPALAQFFASLPDQPAKHVRWTPGKLPMNEGLTLPSQVNYVGKAARLDSSAQPRGSAIVANRYLGTTWLWEKVRAQGGAYGGFSVYDHLTGIFTFVSYRDPNLMGTLETYDHTGDFLRGLELNEEELTRAIIGTIGDMDTYQLPDARGYTSLRRYLAGDTNEIRQQRRDQVLATTSADFHAFGDALDAVRDHGLVVILGGDEGIRAANQQAGSKWLTIQKVM